MSFETQPAFVHSGDWDAITDAHPAMKWMRDYTNEFDKGGDSMWATGKWHSPDFHYVKSTGQSFPKGKESWDAVVADYKFFTKWRHEPYLCVCWEQADGKGWEMLGNAWLFANLPGHADGESVKDNKGTEWQMKVPAGFHFVYPKEGNSIKMSYTGITNDSGPVVVQLLQRGVMKPADIGL